MPGPPADASLVRAGDAWSLIVGTRSYEISFGVPASDGLASHGAERDGWIVYVNGRAVPVEMPGRLKAARAGVPVPGAAESSRPGSIDIAAPMPGRIVKVLVKPGDRVAARQGLVVVEAMKMENELRAPRDGVVTGVKAVEGALVEARAVLVVLE